MTMPMRAALAAATAVPAIAALWPAAAQDAVELPEIVVSGGLTPIGVDAFGRAFSVITAEEIERRQIVYLADALRAVPGVSVNRTGGPGGLTAVRLRGAEGNHTLVLIDGVEVSAPENGEFDFGGLLAAGIARIEVLRGPQSSLYGSNAIGGVISIFTKRAETRGLETGGRLEGGSDATVGGDVFLRGRNEDAAVSLSVAGLRAGGFDVSGDPGGEDDRDRNVTANGRLEVFATDSLSLGGTIRFTDRESDFDGFAFGAPTRGGLVVDEDNATLRTDLYASVFADLETLGGRLVHRAQLGYADSDAGSTQDGATTSDTTATRLAFDWRSTLALDAPTIAAARHTLTLAANAERETFENNDPRIVFDPSQLERQERDLFGVAAEYRGSFLDALDIQLGLRHDVNDDFDDATTYSAGVSYALDTGTRFHGSVGTGVQNPTFFEQFGFIPGEFNGNPDLEPEKSFGWDIGVEQSFLGGRAVVDVTYFRQTLEDEIFTDFPPPDFIGTPFNDTGESERQGVEVSASLAPLPGLTVDATYTYLDADDFDGTREIRRPRHEGGLVVSYSFLGGRASATLDGRVVAGVTDADFRAPSFGTGNVKLDDYVLLNLAGSYRVNDRLELFARVNNLTDADYEEVFGYESQGITGFAGLSLRF